MCTSPQIRLSFSKSRLSKYCHFFSSDQGQKIPINRLPEGECNALIHKLLSDLNFYLLLPINIISPKFDLRVFIFYVEKKYEKQTEIFPENIAR